MIAVVVRRDRDGACSPAETSVIEEAEYDGATDCFCVATGWPETCTGTRQRLLASPRAKAITSNFAGWIRSAERLLMRDGSSDALARWVISGGVPHALPEVSSPREASGLPVDRDAPARSRREHHGRHCCWGGRRDDAASLMGTAGLAGGRGQREIDEDTIGNGAGGPISAYP